MTYRDLLVILIFHLHFPVYKFQFQQSNIPTFKKLIDAEGSLEA